MKYCYTIPCIKCGFPDWLSCFCERYRYKEVTQ
ncbi:hypothetical protein PsPphi15_gp29 [Pseudomonas phage phi15]|uniref:Uncharacterized protein n=1 Tax=Pseudomonas phage phi15 TaxID=988656 RepID=F0V6Z0_9CAUD|nr:hypothetical protein PsPphi15_gp29 [Pseudomonas phage phi15]CBZ42002.1 hypothetical protein [Pseudomonas phage phi15]